MGISPALPFTPEFFEDKPEYDAALFTNPGSGLFDIAINRKTGKIIKANEYDNRNLAFALIRMPRRKWPLSADEFARFYLGIHREYLLYSREQYDISKLPGSSVSDKVTIAMSLLEALQDVILGNREATERRGNRLQLVGFTDVAEQIDKAMDSPTAAWVAERAMTHVALRLMAIPS